MGEAIISLAGVILDEIIDRFSVILGFPLQVLIALGIGGFAVYAGERAAATGRRYSSLHCGVDFIAGLTVFLIVASLIRHRSHVDGALAGVAIPMLVLAFGIALLRFGRHLSRSGEARLQRFICETLSAREVSAAGGAVSSR
jgi:hypothetical protein